MLCYKSARNEPKAKARHDRHTRHIIVMTISTRKQTTYGKVVMIVAIIIIDDDATTTSATSDINKQPKYTTAKLSRVVIGILIIFLPDSLRKHHCRRYVNAYR